jgi:hypothetical protein
LSSVTVKSAAQNGTTASIAIAAIANAPAMRPFIPQSPLLLDRSAAVIASAKAAPE